MVVDLSRGLFMRLGCRTVCAVSGILLLGVTAACNGSTTSYSSPDAAVAAGCHAAKVIGVYTYGQDPPALQRLNAMPGRIQLGWRASGPPSDDGWIALVQKQHGGYHVSKCKWKVNVHG
jgi:hypothetical protein